ncbi:MAG: M67 family metallopeptidase [Anaerolineales bacterium]
MTLIIPPPTLNAIYAHLEAAYPEEGAGFLLGRVEDNRRIVTEILTLTNARENAARHNRYLLTGQDVLRAEDTAEQRGLTLLGVFHSHPDCPNRPSEFDREWAMPWFSYLITRVDGGIATASRSWRLSDDRSRFDEETLVLSQST